MCLARWRGNKRAYSGFAAHICTHICSKVVPRVALTIWFAADILTHSGIEGIAPWVALLSWVCGIRSARGNYKKSGVIWLVEVVPGVELMTGVPPHIWGRGVEQWGEVSHRSIQMGCYSWTVLHILAACLCTVGLCSADCLESVGD